MSNRSAAVVVVIVLAVIGAVIGFSPQSVTTDFGGTQACGSAFVPNVDDAEVSDLAAQMRGETSGLVASCDEELSVPRTFALVILSVAGLAGIGLGLTRKQAEKDAAV